MFFDIILPFMVGVLLGGFAMALLLYCAEKRDNNEEKARFEIEKIKAEKLLEIAEYRCSQFKDMYEMKRECERLRKQVDRWRGGRKTE